MRAIGWATSRARAASRPARSRWSATSRTGGAREGLARLSELELPIEGSLVGEVARVGARILVDRDRIDLLVPSMVSAHVRERIETDCAELLR